MKKHKYNARRGVYFCIGFSTFWPKPLHLVLKSLKERHNLRWLRVSMSYHRFPNMRDIFQSQLFAKMIENVESLDFKTRDCSCRSPTKSCQYGNICRVPVVVYKVKCNTLGKIYMGNIQQFFKARMRGHFQDVKQYVEKHIFSYSYAKHFGGMVPKGAQAPTPGMQRNLITCSIIWKGGPITAVQKFGMNSCKLCNRERMAIIKTEYKSP
jgi:hypothetical protein